MKPDTGQGPDPYRLGIVEGFFGRQWSWQDRQQWVEFLPGLGFNTYIYAPKGDRLLRQQWQEPFTDTHSGQLQALAACCKKHDIDFGIGLSPMELYLNFDTTNRNALTDKLQAINEIKPDTLCLLFDDMPGDMADLAERQCEIMQHVSEHSTARSFIFCPTYYSTDPILAKYFGKEPQGYLDTLGQLLAPDVDIFWTGPKVISSDYPADHLQEVAHRLGRKPVIWDNYPVNDSKTLCEFLNIAPQARDTNTLKAGTRGHLANPMNQPDLSRFPVLALALQYQGAQADAALCQKVIERLASPPLAQALVRDLPGFSEKGLSQLSPAEISQLQGRYEKLLPDPVAAEILDWLAGGYAFDPACLT